MFYSSWVLVRISLKLFHTIFLLIPEQKEQSKKEINKRKSNKSLKNQCLIVHDIENS